MADRQLRYASCAVVILLALIASIAVQRLPAGTRLPIHWNASGQADRFADAARALFGPPATAAILSLLFTVLPRVDPLRDRIEASAPLLRTAWLGLLGLTVVVEAVIAAPAFGYRLPAMLPLAGTGALLILIGSALPRSQPGFFVGIRTPWTLTDDDNWIATHRLGARTMTAGGAVILAAALLPLDGVTRRVVVAVAIALAVIPPVIFSYLFWRRRQRP